MNFYTNNKLLKFEIKEHIQNNESFIFKNESIGIPILFFKNYVLFQANPVGLMYARMIFIYQTIHKNKEVNLISDKDVFSIRKVLVEKNNELAFLHEIIAIHDYISTKSNKNFHNSIWLKSLVLEDLYYLNLKRVFGKNIKIKTQKVINNVKYEHCFCPTFIKLLQVNRLYFE